LIKIAGEKKGGFGEFQRNAYIPLYRRIFKLKEKYEIGIGL